MQLSGEAEEEFLEFVRIGGVFAVRVGEAFLECGGDNKESCAIECFSDGRELVDDVPAVSIVFDCTDHGGELSVRAAKTVHHFAFSFLVVR